MWSDRHATVDHPLPGPGPLLETIYRVHGNPSYDVTRKLSNSGRYECFRTLSGAGEVEVDGSPTLLLNPGSLFLARPASCISYRCREETWDFWWYCFALNEVPLLPVGEVLEIPGASGEDVEAEQCMAHLRELTGSAHRLASARFSMLLSGWGHRHAVAKEPSQPHREAIRRILRLMADNPARPLLIGQLAKAANLSERRFRTVFEEITGETPKTWQMRLRLEAAAGMLRMTPLTIAQIAGRLGFSSPFHLSRDFSRAFGMPPSHYRHPGVAKAPPP